MREEELLKRLDEWFKYSHLGSSEYFTYKELLKAKEQIRNFIKQSIYNKNWLPTPENINVLPEPIRKYIHDIETNCSPANMVQENTLLKDTCEQLEKRLEMSSNRIKVLKRIIDTSEAQQKPEIDDEWIDKKAREFHETLFYRVGIDPDTLRTIKIFLRRFINDARGKEIDVEEIIQAVLSNVICHHIPTHDEDGVHVTVEYNAKLGCHEAVRKVLGVEE